MGALHRRLDKLEATPLRSNLPPHLKEWLGIELTPSERLDLNRHSVEADFDEVDWSEISDEVRQWLQQ